jgi:hypothetical protein
MIERKLFARGGGGALKQKCLIISTVMGALLGTEAPQKGKIVDYTEIESELERDAITQGSSMILGARCFFFLWRLGSTYGGEPANHGCQHSLTDIFFYFLAIRSCKKWRKNGSAT